MGSDAVMTDRVKGAYVVFNQDIRVDEVEHLLNAIRMMKYVADVKTDDFVKDPHDWMTRQRIAHETLDVTTFVLQASLTGDVGYCADKAKIISHLESIVGKLRGKP
jgi:hypothetical protein